MKKTFKQVHRRAFRLNIKSETPNYWTDYEITILKQYYPLEGSAVQMRLPNKNIHSCYCKASELKLKAPIPNQWTEYECNILKTYYEKEGSVYCSKLLNRTPQACQVRAQILGLRVEYNYWTNEEDELIKKYYPVEGSAMNIRLNDRSRQATHGRASKLGVVYKQYKDFTKPASWTTEEENILKEYYPIEGYAAFKRLPARSESSCKHKAKKLRLKVNDDIRYLKKN